MFIKTSNFPTEFNPSMTYVGKIDEVYFYQYSEEFYVSSIERPDKGDFVYGVSLYNSVDTLNEIRDRLNLTTDRLKWYYDNRKPVSILY